MSDTAVAAPEPVTPEAALGQTTLEHDGRVYTGTGTDDDKTEAAFVETTQGRKAEAEAAKTGKPIRGQRRFDQLTFEREEAKREADKAKAESAALKAELEAARAKKTEAEPKTEAKPEAEPKADKKAVRPKLEDFLDQPDPIGAFNDALSAHYEQEISTQIDARLSSRLEAERASRQLTQTVADLRERGKSAYSDFEAVLATANDLMMPEPILWAIVNDPQGEHIQYALASDHDLARQVAAIRDPLELGRVLGRLGSAGASAATPPSPRPADKSKAPRPFQVVSGASRTTGKSLQELAESGDVEAYKAKRHADMGIKAR